jgi:nucleoside-diphosphate-sugar epimerase
MTSFLVTGATGLVGANLCDTLAQRGDTVRALARNAAAGSVFNHPKIAVVEGDITDADAVKRAADGVDVIVHCAAILGGIAGRYAESDYEAINLGGTRNVLDAASDGCRIVTVSSITALQTPTVTVTETSPIPDEIENASPYIRSKRLALLETMHSAESGVDVCAVVPGGIFGPSPAVSRALATTSFNHDLRRALRGEVSRYARVRLPWSYAPDVVDVILAAAQRGRRGARYLAMAGSDETCTVAELLNRGCAVAGVVHRVQDVGPGDDPGFDEEFAGMARLARRLFPEPLYDNRGTIDELGVEPTAVDEALAETVRWLEEIGSAFPGLGPPVASVP